MGERKACSDWHKPDENETVFLPLLQQFCHFVTFIQLKTVNVYKEANSKLKQVVDIFYDEAPESFSGETDVDNCFNQNILDIFLSDNRIVQVSKNSNKKIFAFKLFQVCNLKNQQRFIPEAEVSV